MSDSHKRVNYSKEFKLDALNLSKQPGYTVPLAARRLGIKAKSLYRWRQELEKNGALAFPGNGNEALSDKDRHIRELEKRLKDAELERDILKKAVGIFSKASK